MRDLPLKSSASRRAVVQSSLVLPSLRPDLHDTSSSSSSSAAPPPPYLLGYWSKVAALLCKRRPAALMQYLNLQVWVHTHWSGARGVGA